MFKKVCILSGILLVSLMFCSKKNSTGIDPGTPEGAFINVEKYSMSGDTFTYVRPGMTFCWDSVLESDSGHFGYDLFKISGNRFYDYMNAPETLTYAPFAGSGLVIQAYQMFSRIGAGSGLMGTWRVDSAGYFILAGTASPAQRDSLYKRYAANGTEESRYVKEEAVFTRDSVYIYGYRAGMFLLEWNYYSSYFTNNGSRIELADSAAYNVTVTTVNESTVKLTGRKTGEVVTVTYGHPDPLDVTYSSSISNHVAGTVYYNPTHCPNDVPPWYNNFLAANIKPGYSLFTYKSLAKKPAPTHRAGILGLMRR